MSISDKFDRSNVIDAPLPFRVKASFKAMFDHWEGMAQGDDPDLAKYARKVLDSVAHATEIHQPFDDYTLLDKYEKEIRILFAPVFPEPLKSNEIKAASLPFRHFFFNPTTRLKNILDETDKGYHLMVRDLNPDDMYIFACMFLINTKYKANIIYKRPFFFDIPAKKDKFTKHYRAFFNGDFAEFKPNENARELSKEDVLELVDNFDNVALWKEKIPPNSYDFEGFGLVTLFDVTTDEALSSMKNILLESDALNSLKKLELLQRNMRSFFNADDIQLGFATYDRHTRKVHKLGSGECMIFEGGSEEAASREDCFCDHSASQVFDQHKTLIMSDIDKYPDVTNPLLERMRAQKIKSFIITPLEYDKEIIGFLELTSRSPYLLNSVLANKLKEVNQLFTVAMKRAMDERETKLEAIVQEKFTSIHPSVSWRFTEVAEKVLESRLNGAQDHDEEVVFRDVVPIYGQFDIRGSSTARNEAIQADLVRQLINAENVMEAAANNLQWPIYDQLKYHIRRYRELLESNINAGDEIKILEFLKSEIYPVFNHLAGQDPGLQKAIGSYMMSLDPELNVIYDRRKKYEDSVTMINEVISGIVDEEQEAAQQMLPHYFEKYKTDGVEYNLYLGQSLLQNRTYDTVHLKNMRIWQLLMTYKVEQRMKELQEVLPMPLEIASLLLVHSAPLSIKFRQDEKKFDVDGAYNIRYEIVKKRIDKANIKGTNERLTRPGKLAIVYSHDDEVTDYVNYLEYLHSLNMITGEIEHLHLEDLQGTAGLKALRATWQFNETPIDTSALEKAIHELKN